MGARLRRKWPPFQPLRWPGGTAQQDQRRGYARERVCGQAQFGAMHGRRSAPGSTLLAAMATAWH